MDAHLTGIVAQHVPTFSIAHLRTAYAAMLAAHPEQESRLQRALTIVVTCDIEPFISRGDAWQVQSLSDPDTYYVVTTFDRLLICSCPDAANRGLPCKHTLAIELYRRAERRDAEQADPTPADNVIPLPTPVFDSDRDRFVLTAKGHAALASPEHTPA